MSKNKEPEPFIPSPTPPKRVEGRKYEVYEYITAFFPKSDMLGYLNQYGAEGWQLTHMLDEGIRAPSTGHGTPTLLLTVLFMRVKP